MVFDFCRVRDKFMGLTEDLFAEKSDCEGFFLWAGYSGDAS